MNPNAVETLTWETDDHGTWTAYLGWNGLALFVLAETGGSALILDDATAGLLNDAVLGPTVDGWSDVGCDLQSLGFRRGASDDGGVLSRYEAGHAELTFDNTELHFEPDNPAWRITLGTTIVVLARDRGTIEAVAANSALNPWDFVFGLFKGTIDDWQTFGYEAGRQASWSLVDDVARLQAYNGLEQSATGAGDTTEQRLNRFLELANWSTQTGSFSAAEFTDVIFPLAGVANPTHQATTLAQPVWEMMLRAADAGQRSVFVSGTGLVVAVPVIPTLATQWETWSWGCDDGQIPLVSAEREFSKRTLINTVDAARAGGSEFVVQDETSQLRHGLFRTGRNDLTLEDDNDVQAWAGTIIQWSSEPTPRITRMRVSPSLWPSDDLEVDYLQEHYELVDLDGPHPVAVIVGNSGSLTTSDQQIVIALDAIFGVANVTVFDDSTAEGSITGASYDLLVVSDSVTSAGLGTKWLNFSAAVLNMSSDTWDNHELSDIPGGGTASATFVYAHTAHDWLSLPFNTTWNFLFDGGTATPTFAAVESDLPAGAQFVIHETLLSTQVLCWIIDTGGTRSDSSAAPARRAALSPPGDWDVADGGASAAYQTLFQDLCAWLVPSTYAQEVSSTPATSNAWTALLEFSDWVGSSWAGEDTGLRHVVDVEIPGTERRLSDTVTIRGIEWRLDSDTVDIEFVTSTITQFLDLLILDDDTYGLLDAGHRVG